MAAGQDNGVLSQDWGWYWYIAALREVPQFVPVSEIIAADLFPPVDDDLNPSGGFCDDGGAPGWHLFTRRAPDLPAVFCVVGGEELLAVDIALDDDLAVVEDGR